MPRHAPVPLAEVDLSDIDGFADLRGYSQFDTLRAEDPVHWNEEKDGAGFWAVTRYADIWAVDRDVESFTSEKFVNLEDVDDDLRDFRRSLLETDGSRHHALRRLIQREFTPRNLLKNYEGFLRQLTKQTVDRAFAEAAANDGRIDFVTTISADFPIQVLARLLDVPPEDTPQLIAWGNEMVANTDPDYAKVRADLAESDQYRHLPFRSPTVQEVWDYGNRLKDERVGGQGSDLITILANKLPDDGVPLSQQDFNNYFSLLVIAGNETTRHAISNSMLGLMEQPSQLRLLQERPELLTTAVEELLRWASPVYHFRRTATRDVELGGKQIKKDDKVVMWFASGNRDDEVFADPYTIDVTRTNVDHMTFGKGSPHLCMGANLARMEIRLMFEELLPRLGSIELVGDVRRIRSNFVNGIKSFPVRISPAA
ncbi:cytochrome P450 [Cryptosporangium aurantiacum]|uniref:Cytochrome P450 n=1 Tax=Cryptosporangium aurantiacum TaxID=134849 RepID=A0A1M7R0D9_9ACTN|nr:cytochrome P450 [Cryptosporangium aurantiacum]SHN38138.1 Cytochrome P450 [Cryptosporangium aurantiacum]